MKKIIALGTVLCVLLFSSVALASLHLTPTRIDAVVADGDSLPPIHLTNKGSRTMQIDVYAEWGGHDLLGSVRSQGGSAAELEEFLTFTPSSFILGPGESVAIETKVHFPADFTAPGLYPVIYCQSTDPEAAGQVVTALRLSILAFLERDVPAQPQGEIAGVDIYQSGTGQPIDFRITLDNTGDIRLSALGIVEIFDSGGREIAELGFDSTTVLPGNARWLRTDWQPQMLMPGEYFYKGFVEFDFGERAEVSGTFDVLSPWQVTQRRGEIAGLKTVTATLEEGIRIEGVFHNRGNVPLDVEGAIFLTGDGGSKKGTVTLGEIAPQGRQAITWSDPGTGLEPGDYVLKLVLEAEGVVVERELALQVKGRPDVVEGRLEKFVVDAGQQGAAVNIVFVNSGSLPFDVMGVIEIYGQWGLLGYLEIPAVSLEADQSEEFNLLYDEELAPGEYQAVVTLLYDTLVLREETEFTVK